MAYLVSQLRKNGNQKYMEDVPVSPSQIISPNTFGGDNTFRDFALEGNFIPTQVYFLRFQIHKIPKYFYSGSKTPQEVSMYQSDADDLSLQILLKNDGEDETNYPPEIIGNCLVPRAISTQSEKYSSYSFVFSPSRTFNRLGFRINRVSFDAINVNTPRNWLIDQKDNPEGLDIDVIRTTGIDNITVSTRGKRIFYSKNSEDDTKSGDVCTLVNLVNQTSGWLKIGYQCRPGSLIVVNGEPIRLGRSGIYEINNGTIIDKFMIATPGGSDNSKIDAFLLDYAYKN